MVHASASIVRLIDRWLARSARPDEAALAAVTGLAPATVITGASRGIGLALAERFAETGHAVVLVARSASQLDAAADRVRRRVPGATILTLPLDVTTPDAGPAIDRFLADHGRYLDVLVNNAAIGLGGPFEQGAASAIDDLVALNVAALTRLVRHALPGMKARGRGGILNVSSLGGAVPGPYQAAYYASKAYVQSLTEAVAAESAGSGVRIAVVAPGPVETGFHASMQADNALYRRLMPAMKPRQVARAAVSGFLLGRRVIHPGIIAPFAALAVRLLPHAITVPLVARLLDNRALQKK